MKSVLRRLPTHASRCRPSLSALKTTLQIVNSAGTSVPGLQAAVGTVLQIVEYAEAVKQNRKDAEELATSAAQIVQALLQSTEDLKTEEIDDAFRKDVVDFHSELLRISMTLKSLTEQAIWRRVLKRNEHTTAVAEHRRNLAHAVTLFQIKDGITSRRLMVRQHRELQDGLRSLYTLKVAEQVAPPPPGLPAAENPSFWPTFYRTTALDHVHIAIDFLAPTSTMRNLLFFFQRQSPGSHHPTKNRRNRKNRTHSRHNRHNHNHCVSILIHDRILYNTSP